MVVNISPRALVFVTHTVSTCAAMRFLVLVVCFITLSVVHGTNGNLVDHDSKSLGLEQAEESLKTKRGKMQQEPRDLITKNEELETQNKYVEG